MYRSPTVEEHTGDESDRDESVDWTEEAVRNETADEAAGNTDGVHDEEEGERCRRRHPDDVFREGAELGDSLEASLQGVAESLHKGRQNTQPTD